MALRLPRTGYRAPRRQRHYRGGRRRDHPHPLRHHRSLITGVLRPHRGGRGSVRGRPSPRAWGSPQHDRVGHVHRRSIPTCVGLSPGPRESTPGDAVHPHVRGALAPAWISRRSTAGPSPRAWGSRGAAFYRGEVGRSIPTCVGLSVLRDYDPDGSAVHPHVRGALQQERTPCASSTGPSPRAWGSHRLGRARHRRNLVHPHVRGALGCGSCLRTRMRGPSPRAWGSRFGGGVGHQNIPVHPHVRGALIPRSVPTNPLPGPSPRAWGSPL